MTNNLKLTDGACGYWLSRIQIDAQGSAEAARLAFSGSYAADCGEQARSFSVLGHREYLAGLFSVLWQELGGVFSGATRDGAVPPGARLLASAKSHALSEIVRDINKYSNNVMARQLFLTLGAEAGGPPATTEKSVQAIRRWLSEKGLAFPELVLENGAGLSRIERLSAESLGQLLLAAYHSPVMPELVASLPVAAADGTMKKRLNGAGAAGRAHIKTGSLDDVRAIAGYVLDATGRRWIVVCLINHPKVHNGNAYPIFDSILQWAHSRGGTLPQYSPESPPPPAD